MNPETGQLKKLAGALSKLGWDKATIVAADKRGLPLAQRLASELDNGWPVTHMVKKRDGGILHLELSDPVSKQVVLLDDEIQTGHTLVSAGNTLCESGVEQIVVAVVRARLNGKAWKRLFGLGVSKIYVIDYCPEGVIRKLRQVEFISRAPLLGTRTPKT